MSWLVWLVSGRCDWAAWRLGELDAFFLTTASWPIYQLCQHIRVTPPASHLFLPPAPPCREPQHGPPDRPVRGAARRQHHPGPGALSVQRLRWVLEPGSRPGARSLHTLPGVTVQWRQPPTAPAALLALLSVCRRSASPPLVHQTSTLCPWSRGTSWRGRRAPAGRRASPTRCAACGVLGG